MASAELILVDKAKIAAAVFKGDDTQVSEERKEEDWSMEFFFAILTATHRVVSSAPQYCLGTECELNLDERS